MFGNISSNYTSDKDSAQVKITGCPGITRLKKAKHKNKGKCSESCFYLSQQHALFSFIPGADYMNGDLNRRRVYSWNIRLNDQMLTVCVRSCNKALGHSFRET